MLGEMSRARQVERTGRAWGGGRACRCSGPRAHRTGQQVLFPSLWDPGMLSRTIRLLLSGVSRTGPQHRTGSRCGLLGRGEEDSRGSEPPAPPAPHPGPMSPPEPRQAQTTQHHPTHHHSTSPSQTATLPLVRVLPGDGSRGRLRLDLTWPGLPLEGDFLPPTVVQGVWP